MKISLTHLSKATTIGFSYSIITTLTAYVARKKFPELSHFFYLLSVTLFTSGSIAYLWKEYSNKSYIGFQRVSDTFTLKYPSICYFSCKQAFASSMINDFEKYGFVNYLSEPNKDAIKNYDRIICSVESIWCCRDKYDIVIIDESESICDNLMGEMYMKNKPIMCAKKMKEMIKNSANIMIMDAYLTTRSFDMIKDILGKRQFG